MDVTILDSPGLREIITALIGGLFGLMVAKISRGAPPPVDKSGPGERWQQLVDQMEEWTDRRLAERDEQIRRLDTRVSTMEEKYRAALSFIRQLLQRHPSDAEQVPDKIRDDLHL